MLVKRSLAVPLTIVFLLIVTLASAFLIYLYVNGQLVGGENFVGREGRLNTVFIEEASLDHAKALKITVTNPTSAYLEEYPLLIRLTASNFNDWNSIDPRNVFFVVNLSKPSPLHYWVQKVDIINRVALLWVKVPEIPAGGSVDLYMVYNADPNPYLGFNNPNELFIFYEGAEDGVEGTDWGTPYGAGGVVFSSSCAFTGSMGLLKAANIGTDGAYKDMGLTINRALQDIAIEFHVKRLPPLIAPGTGDRIALIDNGGNGYAWGFSHTDTYLEINKVTLPTVTLLARTTVTDVIGDWQRGILYILGDGRLIAHREYDTLADTLTATDTSTFTFTRVYVFGGRTYCVDDIIVRKTSYPEPTATLASTSQDISLITLYVRNAGNSEAQVSSLYVFDGDSSKMISTSQEQIRILPKHTKMMLHVLENGYNAPVRLVVVTSDGSQASYYLEAAD